MRSSAREASTTNADKATREWLASLPSDVRASIPSEIAGTDRRARSAELRRLQSEGVALDDLQAAHSAKERGRLDDERTRDRNRSRPLRSPPKGVELVGWVRTPAGPDLRSVLRLAREGEKPDLVLPWVLPVAEAPSTRTLREDELEQARRLCERLTFILASGEAPLDAIDATARAYEAIFGAPYRDSWIDVVLEAVEHAAKLLMRLAKDPSRPHPRRRASAQALSERRRLRTTETTPGAVLARIRYRLEGTPGVELPPHVDEALIAKMTQRYGFAGGGGRAAKLGRKALRSALQGPPATLRRLLAGPTSKATARK